MDAHSRAHSRNATLETTRDDELFAATGNRVLRESPPAKVVRGFSADFDERSEHSDSAISSSELFHTCDASPKSERALARDGRAQGLASSHRDASSSGSRGALVRALHDDEERRNAKTLVRNDSNDSGRTYAYGGGVPCASSGEREVERDARERDLTWNTDAELLARISTVAAPMSSPIDIPASADGKNHWKLCV